MVGEVRKRNMAESMTMRLNYIITLNHCRAQFQTKEKSMKRKVGLWIDHRKAIVVTVTDRGEEVGLIIWRAEK